MEKTSKQYIVSRTLKCLIFYPIFKLTSSPNTVFWMLTENMKLWVREK